MSRPAVRPSLAALALALGLAAAPGLAGCGGDGDRGASYDWDLPPGFPAPRVPASNPMSEEKVELGRRLFYDKRLSGNETYSCGSCHLQELAFTDGLANAVGSTGQVHRRGSMSLANIAYAPALTWASANVESLEIQALVPMFGESPVELGLVGMEDVLVERLASDPDYVTRFAAAFPDESGEIGLDTITKAIASFERALISGRSPWDRYVAGEAEVGEPVKRGAELFFGERFECHHCHTGFAFTDAVTWKGRSPNDPVFHNTALYNVDGTGAYPAVDQGLIETSELAADMGRFKTPTLRNITVTAPYMHDGSIATLEEVIVDHYARGGRLIESGPNAGDGRLSPLKDPLISGFAITPGELDDLLAFLASLEDESFLTDPRFSDPFAD